MDYGTPEGYSPEIWKAACELCVCLGFTNIVGAYRMIENAIDATKYAQSAGYTYEYRANARRELDSYRVLEFRAPRLHPLPETDPLVARVREIMQGKARPVLPERGHTETGRKGNDARSLRRRGSHAFKP